jgi:hypothetical protein
MPLIEVLAEGNNSDGPSVCGDWPKSAQDDPGRGARGRPTRSQVHRDSLGPVVADAGPQTATAQQALPASRHHPAASATAAAGPGRRIPACCCCGRRLSAASTGSIWKPTLLTRSRASAAFNASSATITPPRRPRSWRRSTSGCASKMPTWSKSPSPPANQPTTCACWRCCATPPSRPSRTAWASLGFPSRILSLVCGAAFTYAAFNKERSIAPGCPTSTSWSTCTRSTG